MRYMLIILGDESQYANLSDEEQAANGARWADYTKELVDSGAFVSGDGLQSATTATTLRVENGERVLTDGPFAETKELVAGYWVWQVRSMEEAVEWAKRCPNPMPGPSDLEIRPFWEAEDFGPEIAAEVKAQNEKIARQR
jgi:hypothetical protein